MRWLIWRELTVMTRTRALWIAMCGQLWVLASFIVVWGDGVPIMAGTVSEQFATLQLALLLGILPWVAARIVGDEDSVTAVVAVAACAPRQVVVAKYLALLLVLLAVVASALPLRILAHRISAQDLWPGALDLLPLAALCAFVAATVMAFVVAGGSRFAAWVLATVVTWLVALVLSPTQSPMLLLAAFVVTAVTVVRADQRLRFLPIGGAK